MDDQSTANNNIINNRYILRTRLGAGGMGAVFRAFDRLNQHEVALKQVAFVEDEEGSKPSDATMNTRLALANEFQTLASLHHPNIIRVLDYGFDVEKQPYFTMSILEGGQPITAYAKDKSLDEKISLIIEMLQAMAYMHRRNIIHRDLKPDNALVDADGEVQVLDFGLATPQGDHDEDEIAGTIAYMAPEVLQGTPVSKSSDLYAVGIMAYEMIGGKHPFNIKSAGSLIQAIFFGTLDIAALDVPDGVANVIARLTLKEPDLRYDDANKVIEALSRAMKKPVPEETAAIRESYLQAAEFVGREEEMAKLQQALMDAMDSKGSLWIIGGESGVGKSRLLNEIRTQAMVRGAVVLHGQGIAEGGVTYQMWRDPLRRLVLSVTLDASEASILKQIIPDMGTLLERQVDDAPELEGTKGKQRLLETVTQVFRRQPQPIVLLMEDLQWAEESLDMLNHLSNMTAELPLLIIGNYRDDEAPELPKQLPKAETIKLERLDEKGIEQLTEAMLGTSGNRPEVVDFLQRETEGNVFFLVEVVRALAEDAGSLQRIGIMTLPANIFAGGVQQVVQRRLDHVTFEHRNLLRVAAISGRYLDLNVLQAVEPDTDLDDWLVACSNVAVLEAADEHWRFAHDKLREGLLADLSEEQTRNLHIMIAEKMMEVYADTVNEYAGIIADHYETARDFRHAYYWHARAGKHARDVYANAQTYQHYKRALELHNRIDDPLEDENSIPRLQQLNDFAYALGARGNVEESMEYWNMLIKEAEEQGNQRFRTIAWWNVAFVDFVRGKNESAMENINLSEPIARRESYDDLLVQNLWVKGWCLLRLGNVGDASKVGQEALKLCETVKVPEHEAQAANLMAVISNYTGEYEEARQYLKQALDMQEELGEKIAAAMTINNIGYLHVILGDYEEGINYLNLAITRAKNLGHRHNENFYRGNRAGTLVRLGRYDEAIKELREVLNFAEDAQLNELSEFYRFFAEAHLGTKQMQIALEAAHRALELGFATKNPEYVGAAWRVLAQVTASVDTEVEIELNGEARLIEPESSFKESERILKEANILSEYAHTLKEWALYDVTQKNVAAKDKWQQAREIYEKMGANKELERMPKKPPPVASDDADAS